MLVVMNLFDQLTRRGCDPSKNNWESIFGHRLLDDNVLDWLVDAFNRPGRSPDASSIEGVGAQAMPE